MTSEGTFFGALVALLLVALTSIVHDLSRALPILAIGPSPKAIKRLWPKILGFVTWRLRGANVGDAETEAEDLAQEVLIIIVSKWRDFTPGNTPGKRRNALRRWAFGIARGVILDRRRALATRRAFEEQIALAYARRVLDNKEQSFMGALQARSALRRLRVEMGSRRWAVWFAHVAEGYTAEEIASREGVETTSIEWQIREARERAARVLADIAAEEGSGS